MKHSWDIDSIEQHTNGYWNFQHSSFDLRHLKRKQELNENELDEIYLAIDNDRILIEINGDESFYEVENLSETKLDVTCYFQGQEHNSELIRLATFRLSRK